MELITDSISLQKAGGLLLLLGGARSGKSSLAVDLASESASTVVYVATAQAFDEDMKARIERHKRERPDWQTIEQPTDILKEIKETSSSSLLIIDCLTMWVSNLYLRGDSENEISRASSQLLMELSNRPGRTIAISNEVGLGVVPETHLGREFREILGRVNQQWARAAQQSLFLVAGKALQLKNPKEYLS